MKASLSVQKHYDQLLADIYSWSAGGVEQALQRNRLFFGDLPLDDFEGKRVAIDLGAGSGFQSIPLAELGFEVLAIDNCQKLLDELNASANGLPIKTVQNDILNFAEYQQQASLICCMGDTLTHLQTEKDVIQLLEIMGQSLYENGLVVLTFRDYTAPEPEGTQRFIPVASDESRIFTCFLEYKGTHVDVHDLLYLRTEESWVFSTSAYQKLRLDKTLVLLALKEQFQIIRDDVKQGMICIVAKKKG